MGRISAWAIRSELLEKHKSKHAKLTKAFVYFNCQSLRSFFILWVQLVRLSVTDALGRTAPHSSECPDYSRMRKYRLVVARRRPCSSTSPADPHAKPGLGFGPPEPRRSTLIAVRKWPLECE